MTHIATLPIFALGLAFGGLPALVGLPALAAPAAQSRPVSSQEQTRFEGRATAPDGAPVAGVLVQQLGGIASAITDDQGRFVLRLEPGARSALTFSAVGYLPREVPLNQAMSVSLRPVPIYRPGFKPLVSEAEQRPDRFYDTQLGVMYRTRYQSVTGRSRLVEGWANNDLAGYARVRAEPLVLGLEGFRFKAPVTIGPLTAQPAPQPAVETTQWSAWLGYPFEVAEFELLPQIGYTTSYWVPNNLGTPWTGTPLDYNQTRQGVGIGIEAGRAFGCLDLTGRIAVIPALGTVLSGAPYSVGDLRSAELGLGAGYQVVPGLRLGVNAARQWDSGTDLDEWANIFGVSVTYLPERVKP